MEKYALFWVRFHNKKFTFEEAQEELNEPKEKSASATISRIKKAGWLTVELHPETSRKRLYKLKSPEKVIREIAEREGSTK